MKTIILAFIVIIAVLFGVGYLAYQHDLNRKGLFVAQCHAANGIVEAGHGVLVCNPR